MKDKDGDNKLRCDLADKIVAETKARGDTAPVQDVMSALCRTNAAVLNYLDVGETSIERASIERAVVALADTHGDRIEALALIRAAYNAELYPAHLILAIMLAARRR